MLALICVISDDNHYSLYNTLLYISIIYVLSSYCLRGKDSFFPTFLY